MENTGGRVLFFSLHNIDSNDEQSLDLGENIPQVFTDFVGNNPTNFNASFCDPIKSAKVVNLIKSDTYLGNSPSIRYSGLSKPVIVQADILQNHLGSGESTNLSTETQKIAKIIRDRGVGSPPDDCGHIIAKQYGGKIIDYNLFPQDKSINRGLGVWRYLWKWGVELLVRIWLISQAPCDPMVRVRIRLFYPPSTSSTPDRPTKFHYHFQFYKRRNENEENEAERNSNIAALRLFIKAAIYGEIPNECLAVNAEETKKSINAFSANLRQLKAMTSASELKNLLEIYIEEMGSYLNPPQRQQQGSSTTKPLSSNKPFSWWDMVPVVGSVRTLDDAVRCGKDGDGFGAAINGALGVGGLALDVLSLGTINAFANAAKSAAVEGSKAVAKEGTKMAVKKGSVLAAQQVLVIAVEHIIKEGIEALVQTTVTQAARRAIEGIAKLA